MLDPGSRLFCNYKGRFYQWLKDKNNSKTPNVLRQNPWNIWWCCVLIRFRFFKMGYSSMAEHSWMFCLCGCSFSYAANLDISLHFPVYLQVNELIQRPYHAENTNFQAQFKIITIFPNVVYELPAPTDELSLWKQLLSQIGICQRHT